MTKTTEPAAAGVDGAAVASGREMPICAVAATASASILALDQFTKLWVVSVLPLGAHIRVIPGLFDLVHVRNTGAAFGMLSGQNTFLILASVLTLLILWRWRRSLHDNRPARAVVLGVMIGGILGMWLWRQRPNRNRFVSKRPYAFPLGSPRNAWSPARSTCKSNAPRR